MTGNKHIFFLGLTTLNRLPITMETIAVYNLKRDTQDLGSLYKFIAPRPGLITGEQNETEPLAPARSYPQVTNQYIIEI